MFFNKEKLTDIRDELEPLIKIHHKELQPFENLELSPDVDRYLDLEESGLFHSFTIRDEKKRLVGYSAFFVAPHLQYKGTTQAVQDLIFLHPDYRGQGIGKLFIQYVDNRLKEVGAEIVFHYCKHFKSFAPLLESLGYKLIDEVYGRRI